ncbi:MAG: hypothetical protein ABSG07_06185 [Terriglobales bacterium]|jgi:hypothetical protein
MSGSSDAGLTISTSWLDEGQVGAAYFSDSEGKPRKGALLLSLIGGSFPAV